jgi:hypothetical protein
MNSETLALFRHIGFLEAQLWTLTHCPTLSALLPDPCKQAETKFQELLETLYPTKGNAPCPTHATTAATHS